MGSRDWYGKDWKILRSQLVKLCIQFSTNLLDAVHHEDNFPNHVQQFCESVQKDISSKIHNDLLGLWEKCLPLFVNQQQLVQLLENDIKALKGEKRHRNSRIQPRQALGRILLKFFEYERRELIASGMGVSSNKVKTWERLDTISRKLADKNGTMSRCNEDHFNDLAMYVREKCSHDRNLPRRTSTIRDYFYQFSDACIGHKIENIDGMGHLSFEETKGLLNGVGMAELIKCLERLSQDAVEIIDVEYGLGIGKIQYRTIGDFLMARDLTVELYEKKKASIIQELRDCFEYSLLERIGG